MENVRGGGGVVREAGWGCWGGVLGAWIECDCVCDCDCKLEGDAVCKIPWKWMKDDKYTLVVFLFEDVVALRRKESCIE